MGPFELLGMAAVAWILANGVLPQLGQADATLIGRVAASCADVLQTLSIAFLLAAAILAVLPTTAPDVLRGMDLQQLNDWVQDQLGWLQGLWRVPLMVGCGLLALSLAGWATLSDGRARAVGSTLHWAIKVKAVAAVLAACSLSVGIHGASEQRRVDEAKAQMLALEALRLEVAESAVHEVVHMLAEVVASEGPDDTPWRETAEAYMRLRGVLPPRMQTTLLTRSGTRDRAPQVVKEVAAGWPDFSAQAKVRFESNVTSGESPKPGPADELLSTMLESAFDQVAAGPLTPLSEVGNVVIDEMLAAVWDPVVVAPLRQILVDAAAGWLRQGWTRAALREHLVGQWRRVGNEARERLQVARERAAIRSLARRMQTKDAERTLSALDVELIRRLTGNPASRWTRVETHELWALWQGLNALFVSDEQRVDLGRHIATHLAERTDTPWLKGFKASTQPDLSPFARFMPGRYPGTGWDTRPGPRPQPAANQRTYRRYR